MDRVNGSRLSRLPSLRHSSALRLAASLSLASLPFLATACAHWESTPASADAPAIIARASSDDEVLQHPRKKVESDVRPTELPAFSTTQPLRTKVLPINLDTVLRLAEVQNGQVIQARSRVDEA